MGRKKIQEKRGKTEKFENKKNISQVEEVERIKGKWVNSSNFLASKLSLVASIEGTF